MTEGVKLGQQKAKTDNKSRNRLMGLSKINRLE